MSNMTPMGRLRAYYKRSWGLGNVTHRRRSRPLVGLGLIQLSTTMAIGIVGGAVGTYLWLRPAPKR
jgi:hypothetical protein